MISRRGIDKLLCELDKIEKENIDCVELSKSGHFDEIQTCCGITVDISSQYLAKKKQSTLLYLLEISGLKKKIEALFNGEELNTTENRSALHTALRSNNYVMKQSVYSSVSSSLKTMEHFVEALRNKTIKTLKDVKNIVNIGMGGSDLGPRFALNALKKFNDSNFAFYFISDCDPDGLEETLGKLDPQSTLFIVCSKSFKTVETIENLRAILFWSGKNNYSETHCVAVTANEQLANQYGIKTIFPIWTWVGGRFSFCSAINLTLMIAIGPDRFKEMLSGAAAMDKHFKNTTFNRNLPVTLGLTDIFNVNARKATNRAVLVYSSLLDMFVPFLQQLEMESNGKMKNLFGKPIKYATSEIIWGGLGNQAQHAYFQLLCQGTQFTPCEIIYIDGKRYEKLNAHAYHVMNAFQNGSKSHSSDIKQDIPFTKIILKDVTPFTIGSLVALYEHKVFVKSVIWNINPFDQPGVEFAKQLSRGKLLETL